MNELEKFQKNVSESIKKGNFKSVVEDLLLYNFLDGYSISAIDYPEDQKIVVTIATTEGNILSQVSFSLQEPIKSILGISELLDDHYERITGDEKGNAQTIQTLLEVNKWGSSSGSSNGILIGAIILLVGGIAYFGSSK